MTDVDDLSRKDSPEMQMRSTDRICGTQVLCGLHEVVDNYDVFLIDQYGVLHNGAVAYPHAVDCFNQLLARQKTIVLLSNTSKRANGLPQKLKAFGFRDDFCGAVTGGEAAFAYLQERKQTHARCALMTANLVESVVNRQSNAHSLFFGLDHLQVVDIDQAQFLLVEGTNQVCYSDRPEDILYTDFHSTGNMNEHIEQFIRKGRERNLPMLCTNPDLVAMLEANRMVHMGGKIAKMYEEMGGSVVYFGKPLKEHFEMCLDMANAFDNRVRVIHIGDSLYHDVQGAINTGIDSLFIAGGVHAHELQLDVFESTANTEQPTINGARLDALLQQFDLTPTYTLASFKW